MIKSVVYVIRPTRQVEAYLKDIDMTGLASVWAMARRRPKEQRRRCFPSFISSFRPSSLNFSLIQCTSQLEGSCPWTWPRFSRSRHPSW